MAGQRGVQKVGVIAPEQSYSSSWDGDLQFGGQITYLRRARHDENNRYCSEHAVSFEWFCIHYSHEPTASRGELYLVHGGGLLIRLLLPLPGDDACPWEPIQVVVIPRQPILEAVLRRF
jgi:hypothetical protein